MYPFADFLRHVRGGKTGGAESFVAYSKRKCWGQNNLATMCDEGVHRRCHPLSTLRCKVDADVKLPHVDNSVRGTFFQERVVA